MIETKVLVPSMGSSFVARPRLEALGERLLDVPLALVTGGGGFGKSTVLCAWGQRLRKRAHIAWLSLDPQDASLTALVEAVALALRRAVPDLGESVKQLLETGGAGPDAFVAPLINELYAFTEDRNEEIALFLDDVQFVASDEVCLAFLSGFVRAIPPRVHLVLASRRELAFSPVAKLRASGRLLEVDEGDLRFRDDEAVALVDDVEAAHALVERTEGWAMAVQLTAELVPSHENDVKNALPESREALFEFLAEEVVAHQPASLRRDLYALAIPPIIDEPTANELLAQIDPPAKRGIGATTLETIAARGLYLARIDRETWRFHQIFREFLLTRFHREDPERERSLRKRYATMLRRQGRKLEALGQLIDAGEYLEIVEYAQEALITIRFSDRYRQVLYLLAQVPEAIKRERPMLYRLYAMALQRSGAAFEADEQLKICFDAAMAIEDYATACKAQLELGMYADHFRFQGHGDFSRSLEHFAIALEIAQRPELAGRPLYRKLAYWLTGMAHAARFEYDEALRHLTVAEGLERRSERHSNLILVDVALVHGWRGDWRRALEYAELAEELFRTGAGSLHLGHALAVQVRAHLFLREDLSRAGQLSQAAFDAFRTAQQDEELAGAHCLIGMCALAQTPPDIEAALAAAADAQRRLDALPNPVVRFDVLMLRAEAAIVAGRDEDARRILAEADVAATANGDRLQRAVCALTRGIADLAAGREAEARSRFEQARRAFRELQDRFRELVAELAFAACCIRGEDVEPRGIETLLARLESEHLSYVAATTPRSTAHLLAWCLERGFEVGRAERILGPHVGGHAEAIAEMAADEGITPESRIAAIRILARVAPLVQRPLFARLTRDRDRVVAGVAEAVVGMLPASGAPPLSVAVAGTLRVELGGERFDERDGRWTRKKAVELLRLLVIGGGTVAKSAAMEALWPETAGNAETSLRVTLHALRRALQPEGDGPGDYVEYDGSVLRLRRDTFAPSDVALAEHALKRGQYYAARGEQEAARAELERVAALLEDAPGEDGAPEWMRPHVRRWREWLGEALRARSALERKAGDRDAAMAAIEAALAVDPLDEESLCIALDLFLERNETERGRNLFLAYKQRLAHELSLTPGADVLERYSKILVRRAGPARGMLTSRELEILRLVARGKANKEIAGALGIGLGTVGSSLTKIMRKLKVESRAAAVAMTAGLLDDER
ncbi:hypothetical protein EPN44_14475 [bacterium]|nr:MAG: hypothetical protein EPN44_14475 [bacterium]